MRPHASPADRPLQAPHARLLSRMRHDLKTPLAAILGYSELLAGDVVGEVSHAQREVIRRITFCALELEQSLDALVTLLRVELQVLPGSAARAGAGDLARQAVENYADRPGAVPAELDVRSDPEVRTDPRAAVEMYEALMVCAAMGAGASSSLAVRVDGADGSAVFAIHSDPPLREDYWESGAGAHAAEAAGSLIAALGGSARFGPGDPAVVLRLPLA